MNTPLPSAPPVRILTLEGGCNFRDVGGYRTHDGRQLKWGHVFRAGVLSYLTPNDQSQLKQLGVRVICDLRRTEERKREQTLWPDTNTQHVHWDDDSSLPTIRAIATDRNHPYTAAGMHAATVDLYRALPAWIAPRLRDMFARIAQGGVPIVVHCQAGKDRTGIAIALLLAALSVPHETIFEDYLLTNTAGNFVEFIAARDPAHQPVLSMPEDIRDALFNAHADYLHAAFDQIARDHGDVHAFLRQQVGVDEALRSRVQAALLSARW